MPPFFIVGDALLVYICLFGLWCCRCLVLVDGLLKILLLLLY